MVAIVQVAGTKQGQGQGRINPVEQAGRQTGSAAVMRDDQDVRGQGPAASKQAQDQGDVVVP